MRAALPHRAAPRQPPRQPPRAIQTFADVPAGAMIAYDHQWRCFRFPVAGDHKDNVWNPLRVSKLWFKYHSTLLADPKGKAGCPNAVHPGCVDCRCRMPLCWEARYPQTGRVDPPDRPSSPTSPSKRQRADSGAGPSSSA